MWRGKKTVLLTGNQHSQAGCQELQELLSVFDSSGIREVPVNSIQRIKLDIHFCLYVNVRHANIQPILQTVEDTQQKQNSRTRTSKDDTMRKHQTNAALHGFWQYLANWLCFPTLSLLAANQSKQALMCQTKATCLLGEYLDPVSPVLPPIACVFQT